MFWKPDGSILPPVQGLVARAVLEVPELRTRYFERMKELKAKCFDTGKLTNRVGAIAAKVRPALTLKDTEQIKDYEKAVADFKEAIARRSRSLDQQLERPLVPVQFDAEGIATVTNWQTKRDFGKPIFTPAGNGDATGSLQIQSDEGSSIGSWQTVVWLEKGKYRLEGKARTRGLTPDPGDSRAGAGFRARNTRSEKRLLGDSDWQPVQLEFEVQEPLGETQLACELRGTDGEVWFKTDSIRLRRVSAK